MVYALLKKLEMALNPLNILIRCDASVEIGLGHVTRCLVLAQSFKDKGHQVFFAMKNHALGINKVTEQGFKVHIAPTPFNYDHWLLTLSSQLKVNVFIGDVRDGLPINTIMQLKAQKILTVAIDEPSDYRKACDLCFYPPHAQLDNLDWCGFTGKIKQGLEYVLLRPEFYQKHKKVKNEKPNILVMMGGTDPNNLTLTIVRQLLTLVNEIDITVVIPPNHPDYCVIKNSAENVSIKSNITNMADFLTHIDFGIIAFGVTAYELLTMQIPALHICLNNNHWQSSEFFKKNKFAQRIMKSDINNMNAFLHIKPITNNIVSKNMIIDIIQKKVGYGS